jgi:hypothetical protein
VVAVSTPDQHDGPRPQVYARLAHDAERRLAGYAPPRWARLVGWLIVAALVAGVVVAALRVQPWG